VIVDRLTKLAHLLLVNKSNSVLAYAKLYIARILSLHGVPKTIVSDRGPQFVAKFWAELHKSLGTKLIHSSAYHPQTSGQTERVLELALPSKMIQRGNESNANKVFAQEGNCSVYLASQGHCAGVFIGA
jgi:hypothetical protein